MFNCAVAHSNAVANTCGETLQLDRWFYPKWSLKWNRFHYCHTRAAECAGCPRSLSSSLSRGCFCSDVRFGGLDQLLWQEGHVSSPYGFLLASEPRAGLITIFCLWIWMCFWTLGELGSWWPANLHALNTGHSDSLVLAVCSFGGYHRQALPFILCSASAMLLPKIRY